MRVAPLALAFVAACAPTIDGPAERQRASDRSDADRLAQQLSRLPGAVRAEVTLHRPFVDPLIQTPASPGSAAVLIVVDDGSDRGVIARSARALVRGTAPQIPDSQLSIQVELDAMRPPLASIGPLVVEAGSRGRVIGVLAALLAIIAALAGWVAWRERWRLSARAPR